MQHLGEGRAHSRPLSRRKDDDREARAHSPRCLAKAAVLSELVGSESLRITDANSFRRPCHEVLEKRVNLAASVRTPQLLDRCARRSVASSDDMPNKPTTSDEIRQAFLGFFQERGHLLLPGWPLVPIGDPTSLFTSAGMQQFTPNFLGEAAPPAARATTVQRCFRTTDIEEVGDYSHLTMFEMLGNFSFGDYFKRGAIEMAWELLTKVYQLPAERLHVTIFLDGRRGVWRMAQPGRARRTHSPLRRGQELLVRLRERHPGCERPLRARQRDLSST